MRIELLIELPDSTLEKRFTLSEDTIEADNVFITCLFYSFCISCKKTNICLYVSMQSIHIKIQRYVKRMGQNIYTTKISLHVLFYSNMLVLQQIPPTSLTYQSHYLMTPCGIAPLIIKNQW